MVDMLISEIDHAMVDMGEEPGSTDDEGGEGDDGMDDDEDESMDDDDDDEGEGDEGEEGEGDEEEEDELQEAGQIAGGLGWGQRRYGRDAGWSMAFQLPAHSARPPTRRQRCVQAVAHRLSWRLLRAGFQQQARDYLHPQLVDEPSTATAACVVVYVLYRHVCHPHHYAPVAFTRAACR